MMILMFALILSTCYGANSEVSGQKENENSNRLIKMMEHNMSTFNSFSTSDTYDNNVIDHEILPTEEYYDTHETFPTENYYDVNQYYGVYPTRRRSNTKITWDAKLTIDGKSKDLGTWRTEENAVQRVNKEIFKMVNQKLVAQILTNIYTKAEEKLKVEDQCMQAKKKMAELNQPIVQEPIIDESKYNTGPIDAEPIEPKIARELTNDNGAIVEEKEEKFDPNAEATKQKIESLKASAKSATWYKNTKINYGKYMEKIEQFDWERFVRTERDYPFMTGSKEKLEISLVALKTFMEYKFLREDVGWNNTLFKNLQEEDKFLADMKKIVPLQIYGKDLKGQPVVYADATYGDDEWKVLEKLVNEKTREEPELGLKKLGYYKYMKVLQFIPNSRYLLVTDATKAEDGVKTIAKRYLTMQKLEKAKKYELDMKMAYHNTNDEHSRYGVILFTKKGISHLWNWLQKIIEDMAYDTYIHPNTKILETLQNFIEINQIPQTYNSGANEDIDYISLQPQNFPEMNL